MAKGTTSDMWSYGKVMIGNRPGWYTIIKIDIGFAITRTRCACHRSGLRLDAVLTN